MEEPEVFEATHALLRRLDGRRPGHGRSHRPSGRSVRPAGVLPTAAGDGDRGAWRRGARAVLRGGREDSVGGGVAADGLAGRRNDGLRVPQPGGRRVHRRPERQTAAPRLLAPHRTAGDVRRGGLREQAGHHAHGAFERAQRARACAEPDLRARPAAARFHAEQLPQAPAGSHRLLPGLSHVHQCPRRGRVRPGGHRQGDPTGPAPQSADGSVHFRVPRGRPARASRRRCRRRAAADRRPPAVRHEAAAVQRARAGQGGRGHGVLPVPRARVGQRRRRPSGAPRCHGGGVSRGERQASRPLAVRHGHDGDARHEAGRGHARADQRALGDARDLAAGRVGLDAPQRPASREGRRELGAGPQRRVPLLPDARRRLAGGTGRRARPRACGRRTSSPA